MGVRHGREYDDIMRDLSSAIAQIDGCYEWFEMSPGQWDDLTEEEQGECIKTLADDVFYALGGDPVMRMGTGTISYDRVRHIIKLESAADNRIHVVYLV